DHFADLERVPDDDTWRCGPNLKSVVAERIKEGLDRYDGPVFAPRDTELPATLPPTKSVAEMTIARLTTLFPNNTFGEQLRQATFTNRDDEQSPWVTGVSHEFEVVQLKKVPPGLRGTSLRGVYPLWHVDRQRVGVMGLLALILVLWLSYMVRKLFLTQLAQTPPLERWAAAGIPDSSLL